MDSAVLLVPQWVLCVVVYTGSTIQSEAVPIHHTERIFHFQHHILWLSPHKRSLAYLWMICKVVKSSNTNEANAFGILKQSDFGMYNQFYHSYTLYFA